MQLLSTARMIGAPGEAGSPLAIVPSVTAESTAHQLVANQLLPTRGARRAQSPEESHPPPQDGEGEFSKMYRESVAQDKKLAQEKDREKSDAMNERWEKLESDRVARDVKALRTLVEEMNASQSELRRQLGNERAARLSLEQQARATLASSRSLCSSAWSRSRQWSCVSSVSAAQPHPGSRSTTPERSLSSLHESWISTPRWKRSERNVRVSAA